MAEHQTKIEWTHIPGYRGATWNPVTGCSRVSDGCTHCYAEDLAMGRLKGTPGYPGLPWTKANADVNVVLHPDRLDQTLRWKKPRAVFVNSMSDLFHENIPDEFLDRAFAAMAVTPDHIYMILTKRPERMRDYIDGLKSRLPEVIADFYVDDPVRAGLRPFTADLARRIAHWPLPNVWLGVSAERQRELDLRVPLLLTTPAAVRFVSAEPLLGPLDFENVDVCNYIIDALSGEWAPEGEPPHVTMLDWVIVGGESGPLRRPMHLSWLNDIVGQCRRAGTAVFVKQDSMHRPGQQGRIDDDIWAEKAWPEVAAPA